MAKPRSPNYPRTDLKNAIALADKVYRGQHTHVGAKEVVAKHLGYDSLNGTSLTWIATLSSYGLLENADGGLKVSDDAVTILELPKGEQERVAALRRRAFAPKLFGELRQEFGDNLPSDVNLRHSLIKRGFLPKAAAEVIPTYRETLEFLSEEGKEYNAPDAGELKGESKPTEGKPMQHGQAKPAEEYEFVPLPGAAMEFKFYLSQTKRGVLSIPLELTLKEWELLKKQIQSSLEIAEATALVQESSEGKS